MTFLNVTNTRCDMSFIGSLQEGGGEYGHVRRHRSHRDFFRSHVTLNLTPAQADLNPQAFNRHSLIKFLNAQIKILEASGTHIKPLNPGWCGGWIGGSGAERFQDVYDAVLQHYNKGGVNPSVKSELDQKYPVAMSLVQNQFARSQFEGAEVLNNRQFSDHESTSFCIAEKFMCEHAYSHGGKELGKVLVYEMNEMGDFIGCAIKIVLNTTSTEEIEELMRQLILPNPVYRGKGDALIVMRIQVDFLDQSLSDEAMAQCIEDVKRFQREA